MTGAGRDFSAGVGTSRSSAGTLTCGAWIETGDASDVAVCWLELDLVAIPTPNAPMNNTTAAAAPSTLCEGVLLNLDLR